MNYGEICDEVTIKVQDSSAEIATRIAGFVNETVQRAVASVDVPGFKLTDSVTTSTTLAYVALPSTFSGKLLKAGNDNYGPIEIVDFDYLFEQYPDMDTAGDIVMLAVNGSNLYYQCIPSTAVTLSLLFYRDPVAMSDATDVPDGIPADLHRKIIVNGATALAFDFIEDAETGLKPNVIHYENLYDEGMTEFKKWIAKRTVHRSRSWWRY